MKFKDLKECPFCGCEQFYTRDYAKGYVPFRARFDGEEAENEDMYSCLIIRSSPKCYCSDCQKYLGNRFNNVISKNAEKALNKA